jgi:hypothetical protein
MERVTASSRPISSQAMAVPMVEAVESALALWHMVHLDIGWSLRQNRDQLSFRDPEQRDQRFSSF